MPDIRLLDTYFIDILSSYAIFYLIIVTFISILFQSSRILYFKGSKTMNAVDFQAGRCAGDAHESLLSTLQALDKAQHCAVLWFADIQNRRLYRELGYSSMRQYATRALKFSRSRCGDFLHRAEPRLAVRRVAGS